MSPLFFSSLGWLGQPHDSVLNRISPGPRRSRSVYHLLATPLPSKPLMSSDSVTQSVRRLESKLERSKPRKLESKRGTSEFWFQEYKNQLILLSTTMHFFRIRAFRDAIVTLTEISSRTWQKSRQLDVLRGCQASGSGLG